MAGVDARAAQLHHAARVGRRHDRGRCSAHRPPQRLDLAVADLPRQRRLQCSCTRRPRRSTALRRRSRRARTRRPARVRTAPCAFCTCRRWHGSCTTTRRRTCGRSAQSPVAETPFGEVAHPGAEAARVRGAEELAVLLHRRAAPRAVDDDGRVAGHRRDHARRQAAGPRRRAPRARAARRSSRRRRRDATPCAASRA